MMKKTQRTILILDDEENIRQSFIDYFEDQGWETYEAGSSEQALELLKEINLDAIIVDIRLPGKDGNDFISEAIKINSKTGFIICTGSPEYNIPGNFSENLQVCDHIFRKPVVDMSFLEQQIIKLIKRQMQ